MLQRNSIPRWMTSSRKSTRYSRDRQTIFTDKMPLKKQKGQLSLEFLILLAAFFSVLLLFLPSIAKLHSSSMLALEKKKAVSFAEDLVQAISELQFLSDGSKKLIEINAYLEWQIGIGEKEISIEFSDSDKKISVNEILPIELNPAIFSCSGKCLFSIQKQNGSITISAT